MRKWWRGHSSKSRDGPYRFDPRIPAFGSQHTSTDLLSARDHSRQDGHVNHDVSGIRRWTKSRDSRQRLPDKGPQEISTPYNFQHHMHVLPDQFRKLADASQNELVAEFSAIRAAQSARRHLDGVDAGQIASGSTHSGLTQSAPSSFQVTARSSVHVPEPCSPTSQSDEGIQYVASKASFSMPFRDGQPPKLRRKHPSTESNKITSTSDDTVIGDAPLEDVDHHSMRYRDTRGGALCTRCACRINESDIPTEANATPARPSLARSKSDLSTYTNKGLETGFHSSPYERDDGEFKELGSELGVKPSLHQAQPDAYGNMPITSLKYSNVRPHLRQSPINGGLFSSWATTSESSDDVDAVVAQEQNSVPSPQQKIAKRLMKRVSRRAKVAQTYQAPTSPPPMSPLPRVPETLCPTSRSPTDSPLKVKAKQQPRSSTVLELSEPITEVDEPQDPPKVIPENGPTRQRSIKNVRFKTDYTMINNTNNSDSTQQADRNERHDRFQVTLDDLQKNLSRLETDLTRRPSNSSKTSSARPKTSDGKMTPADDIKRHRGINSGGRTRSLISNRPKRSKSIGYPHPPPADLSKLYAPLPPLPPNARIINKMEGRYSRDRSVTVPTTAAIPSATTIAV